MGYNQKMYGLGSHRSIIREIFEYSKARAKEIGAENVFDFSLGNPNVPAPEDVKDALISLLSEENSVALHGYTSAVGDNGVREAIADYINKTYNAGVSSQLIYMTCGAAASLTITLNAIVREGDEIIIIAPFFPEYRVFIEKAGADSIQLTARTISQIYDKGVKHPFLVYVDDLIDAHGDYLPKYSC